MSDIWEQLANYRKVRTLVDGSRLLLRPLEKGDRDALIDLFARAAQEDLENFRDDAADPEVVGGWVDSLDLSKVYPVVAVVDDMIVGDATLHFGKRYHRHLAWVRIFLDRDYRRRGIGTLMLQSLTEIARRVGLKQLYTEVVASQVKTIKAFQDLGFQSAVLLQDYFVTNDGEYLDMEVLNLQLVDTSGQF